MMYNNTSTVSASFRMNGEIIQQSGVYSVAKISVKNFNVFDKNGKSLEEFTLLTPSKTLVEPVLKQATRNLHSTYPFIEMALNLDKNGKSCKPKPPKKGFDKWLRTKEGQLYLMWNKATDVQKIQVHLENIAHDLKAELISFQINE